MRLNADGTTARERLSGFIPVEFSNGPVAIQFTLTDGDARVLAAASPEELTFFGAELWARLVYQVKDEVERMDREARGS